MMTSMSNDRFPVVQENAQTPTTHAAQPQKQVVQGTSEHMQLAQVIFDKNDSNFEGKVKQLMEVTRRSQHESIVAVHDCDGDVNTAVNMLLEGDLDTTPWETVGGRRRILGTKGQKTKNSKRRELREKQIVDGEATT